MNLMFYLFIYSSLNDAAMNSKCKALNGGMISE
jgi:hypothetical protein